MKRADSMKKTGMILVSIGLISGLFSACNTTKNISQLTYSIDNNYNSYEDDSYENHSYKERGVYIGDEPFSYIIAMGSRNSGGYSIKITEINIDENNNVEVIVEEREPSAGEGVTMAFTYPICKVVFNGKPSGISVKNTEGEEFDNIDF
jgi:hypothetical protein